MWIFTLLGCVLGKYRDDQLCDDIGYAYSAQVFECTADGDAANAAFDELFDAFPCRVERVEFVPAPTTPYSVEDDEEVAVVHTADEVIDLERAYTCVPVVRDVDCALVGDVTRAWPEIVAAAPICGRLLGEGPVPTTTTTPYSYYRSSGAALSAD